MTHPSSGYTCRPATLTDLDAVADVLRQVFGRAVSAEALRHKFGGPAGTMLGSVVLSAGSQTVGFLGQVPLRAMSFGRELLAVQGTDIAILPAHRRFDLFLQLVATSGKLLRDAGVVLAFGVANAEATLAETTLLGVQPLAPVPLLVRALDAARIAPCGWARQTGTWALASVWRLAEIGGHGRGATAPTGLRLCRLSHFDARFDQLWRQIGKDYPVGIVRDAAYLNWRFADCTNPVYEILCLESLVTGEIAGYAVLTCTAQSRAVRGRLMDLVTPRHSDPRVPGALIRASLAWFRQQDAGVADAWMFPHIHLRGPLLRHGFLPRRTGAGRFCVSLPQPDATLAATQVLRAGNWFLSLGDSDTA